MVVEQLVHAVGEDVCLVVPGGKRVDDVEGHVALLVAGLHDEPERHVSAEVGGSG